MSDFQTFIGFTLGMRLALIASGTLSLYLGYRLFSYPLKRGAEGELQITHGTSTLTFRTAAPGLFFALFGACIVGTAVYRPVEILSVEPIHGEQRRFAAREDGPSHEFIRVRSREADAPHRILTKSQVAEVAAPKSNDQSSLDLAAGAPQIHPAPAPRSLSRLDQTDDKDWYSKIVSSDAGKATAVDKEDLSKTVVIDGKFTKLKGKAVVFDSRVLGFDGPPTGEDEKTRKVVEQLIKDGVLVPDKEEVAPGGYRILRYKSQDSQLREVLR